MNAETSAFLPSEIIAAIVCEKMCWTIQEYDAQPGWFVQTLLLKWAEDTAYQKQKMKVE